MPRNPKIIVGALAILGVLAAILISVTRGEGSAADPALKQTAARLQSVLKQSDSQYNGNTFLNSFNLFQAQERHILQSKAPQIVKRGQLAQVTVWETTTMPPVWQNMTQRGKQLILMDASLFNEVASGKSVSTTVQQGTVTYRAFLTPLPIPPTLASNQTHGMVAVFEQS